MNRLEVKRLAGALAEKVKAPFLLSLEGPLGVGKTFFTQQFVSALGSSDIVTSPTYTIVNEYSTLKGDVIHIDAYRVSSREDLESIGFFEYLDRELIIVMEWGSNVSGYVKEDCLIKMRYSGEERELDVYTNI